MGGGEDSREISDGLHDVDLAHQGLCLPIQGSHVAPAPPQEEMPKVGATQG